MKKILIVDDVHPILMDELRSMGYEVDYRPTITAKEVYDMVSQYEGIVVRSKVTIDVDFLAKCSKLEFIARAGAGIDQLDEEAILSRGIKIINAPEGNRNALAEHMVGMLLSLFHKLHKANMQVRSGIWDREGNRGVELRGKIVAIIGYGHMGSTFAQKLSSFGCKIMAYDISKKGFGNAIIHEATMSEIFDEADILSMHVPLTLHTKGMVSMDYIGRFRKPFYFLNSARGQIMNTQHVVEALKTGKILGACLDVLENEKFSTYTTQEKALFEELADFPQVILSPHVAGWTVESYEEISRVLVQKIHAIGGDKYTSNHFCL